MIVLTDENFEKEIQNSLKPVLVDFWAIYCNPCFVLSPILEKIAEEYKEKIIFAKVDLALAPLAAQKYGIDRIPTIILFKEGKPVSGFIGAQPETMIRNWLEENLKNNTQNVTETIKEYKDYAIKNGFKLNPNREALEKIINGLLENKKKYGVRYCPCRRVTENPEENKKLICPCYWHREEIERDGHCLCGLFVKPN